MSQNGTAGYQDDEFFDSVEDMVQTQTPDIRITKRALLGELLGKTRNYEIRGANTPLFVKFIKEYAYNNAINPDHVTYLATEIKKTHCVIGNFTTVELENHDIYLLDGHHRLTALKRLSDADLAQVELTIFNYKSDVIASTRTMDLFNTINNVKPYNINFQINNDCVVIITQLKRLDPGFKSGIRDNESGLVMFPNILESKFKLRLEARLKELPRYNVENVITQILAYNHHLLDPILSPSLLFKSANPIATGEMKKVTKARDHKFMLSLPMGDIWPSKILG
jgi:hypothetical protein